MEIQKSCGIILFDKDCNVLLVQGWHNHWGFPKGHIEQGETCIEAALRELKEEINLGGVDIKVNSDLVFKDEYIFTLDGKRVLKFVDYFVGELEEGFEDKIRLNSEEILAWKAIPIHQALDLLDFENQRNILQKAYANFCKV